MQGLRKLVAIASLAIASVLLTGCGPLTAAVLGTIFGIDAISQANANNNPVVTIDVVARDTTGTVAIPLTVADQDNDSMTATIEYSIAAGAFTAGTPLNGSVGKHISTTSYSLQWDAATDLGDTAYRSDVVVRVKITDGRGGSATVTSASFEYGNDVPLVTNVTMAGGALNTIVRGNAIVSYTVSDTSNDLISLVGFEWSIDDFVSDINTISPINTTNFPVGTFTNLSASVGGNTFNFVWDSAVGIPATDIVALKARITVQDSHGGVSSTVVNGVINNPVTQQFQLNNGEIASAPVARITGLTGSTAGQRLSGALGEYLTVDYELEDANTGQTVDATIEYSSDGTNWFSCTPVNPAVDITTALSADADGEAHSFRWNAYADALVGSKGLTLSSKSNGGGTPSTRDQIDFVSSLRIRITPANTAPVNTVGSATVLATSIGNDQPSLTVTPFTTEQSRIVSVFVTLVDPRADSLDLIVEWRKSTDDPVTGWKTATVLPNDDSITDLSSSAAGVAHAVLWDAEADIADSSFRGDVIVRVAAADGGTGTIAEGIGTLRSDFADTGLFFDRQNTTPTATITSTFPSSPYSGNVPVNYTLIDDQSDTSQIKLQYSTDGGTNWNDATVVGGTPTVSASPSPGDNHQLFWQSTTDLPGAGGVQNNVALRMRGVDSEQGAYSAASNIFQIDNTAISNTSPTLTASGVDIIDLGGGNFQARVTVGSMLSDVITLRGSDVDGGDPLQMTLTHVATAAYPSFPLPLSSNPSFSGGIAFNSATAPADVLIRLTATSAFSSAGTMEFSISLEDGTNSPVAGYLTIVINIAPAISTSGTIAYTENNAATILDSALTVSDSDDSNLESATVSITGNYASGQDVLATDTTGTSISASFSAGTGVLTLTGSDTVANYQLVLRKVTYVNTSENPSGASRTISFVVNDGDTNSATDTVTVNVTPVNDAPVLSMASSGVAYPENSGQVLIDGTTLTVSDVDNTNLQSATVTISSGYASGEDFLDFTNQLGITGSFVSGTLTLTGSATLANWQTALRSVAFRNDSDTPTAGGRTIQVTVNDGSLNSNTGSRVFTVSAINDPPVVTTTGSSLNYIEKSGQQIIDPAVTVSDLDHTSLPGATVAITVNYDNSEDVLAFT
ncbi:MAG: beta strand repeat-containing protein, partial [Planctomycetota bacterium]